MINKGDTHDPKGLIFEAFRIDGITKSECRSIFLDWALSLPVGRDTTPELHALLKQYKAHADHPMNEVLTEGLAAADSPRRRGGRRARVPSDD